MGNTMPSSQINSIDSLCLEFDNFDDFNASIRGWSTSFNQVERGLAKVRLRHRMTPQINALDVSFTHSTASYGSTQPGHRTFGMVDLVPGCSWCRHDVNENQILRFDSHDEFETYTPSGFTGRTLSVDEALLEEVADHFQFNNFLKRLDNSRDVLTVDPLAAIRFRQHYDEAHRTEQSLRTIVEQLLILVETQGIEGGSQRQKNSSRLVDDALNYIVETSQNAPTVADICFHLGVGYKALDRAFKSRLGYGPKSSILAFRLNRVRAELRSSGANEKIVDIANRWGFWHQGDLARIYRQEFGELPRDTQRDSVNLGFDRTMAELRL
jgi:AraC family ethanolamine operon transcriptional activator